MAPVQWYHLKEEVKQTFRCSFGTDQDMILVKGPFEAYQRFRKLKNTGLQISGGHGLKKNLL